jgi:hypothetical protein
LPSGAFRIRPNDPEVIPYWGNYATIGLGAVSSRIPEAATMGWRYLDWYASRQNGSSGFVQDHVANASAEIATGSYDSTDSYAGTFLVAVESMYEGTQCRTCVEKLLPALSLSIKAITATQDVDGLTWAKPEGHVKYLLDQAEVAAGLRSARRLSLLVGDGLLANRIDLVQRQHDAGLKSMMGVGQPNGVTNSAGIGTLWAIAESKTIAATFGLGSERVYVNEAILYPDSFASVAVAALVPDAIAVDHRAAQRYIANWPRWKEDPDTWGYPVLVAWALQNSGATLEARTSAIVLHTQFVDGYQSSAITAGHIGQLLMILR